MQTRPQGLNKRGDVTGCEVCGWKVVKKGGRWRHESPQPSGDPHDHPAKPNMTPRESSKSA